MNKKMLTILILLFCFMPLKAQDNVQEGKNITSESTKISQSGSKEALPSRNPDGPYEVIKSTKFSKKDGTKLVLKLRPLHPDEVAVIVNGQKYYLDKVKKSSREELYEDKDLGLSLQVKKYRNRMEAIWKQDNKISKYIFKK